MLRPLCVDVLVDPINVITNWCKSGVVLAVLDDKASNSVLFPTAVTLSAHIWTSTVPSASIGQARPAKTSANHVPSVEAVSVAHNWKHSLLQSVV